VTGEPLSIAFSLGNLYVNNFVPKKDELLPRSPLELGIGTNSGLVQLTESVPLDTMYRHYWYRSGTNDMMKRQLMQVVDTVRDWVELKNGDVVVDIGSNDGTMLSYYPKYITTIGFDPALNLADEARLNCSVQIPEYFTAGQYHNVITQKAKAVTSIAMFYDLENPRQFVEDVYEVLDDDGVWVVQMSYTPLMLAQNAFDNICHEHLEYYTLTAFHRIVSRQGFSILDATLNNTNAGSFRVVLGKVGAKKKRTEFDRAIGLMNFMALLDHEKSWHVTSVDPYIMFGKKVESLRNDTLALLGELKASGKTVMGYGASTKGNTLLQYYGLGRELIAGISERQPAKHGLLTVGSWIPIVSEAEARKANPDYMLVLPWHFIDNFIEREKEYLAWGGRFIVPLPKLEIIDGANH
jgi:hypothetical protein